MQRLVSWIVVAGLLAGCGVEVSQPQFDEAMAELQAELDDLRAENAALESRLAAVEADYVTSASTAGLASVAYVDAGDAALATDITAAVADLASVTYVDGEVADLVSADSLLDARVAAIENAPYATESYVDAAIADLASVAYVDQQDAALSGRLAVIEQADYATVSYVDTADADLAGRLDSIEGAPYATEAEIVALTDDVSVLQAFVEPLSPFVTVDVAASAVIFDGVNLHVRNGLGSTETVNGLGNLVVGYDEPPFADPSLSVKTGSHNVVLGTGHNYLSYGGFVSGENSEILGEHACLLGGIENTALGNHAVVIGGSGNSSNNSMAVIAGGQDNTAIEGHSAVLGGQQNHANGEYAVVVGGSEGDAYGTHSVIVGGLDSTVAIDPSDAAIGDYGLALGGQALAVYGDHSVVVGGSNSFVRGPWNVQVGGATGGILADDVTKSVLIGGQQIDPSAVDDHVWILGDEYPFYDPP
jgi:hypothetical protein